jgi:hypothetical protein
MRASHFTFAIDLGDGRAIDAELQNTNELWVTADPAIAGADVWMKAVRGAIDLRVRIRRTEIGIQVSVDRGDQSSAWWPGESAPQLTIAVEPGAGVAAASARVGVGEQFQEVLLGETGI